MTIGNAIKLVREISGFSKVALGAAANVAPSRIVDYEGETDIEGHLPTLKTFLKLCRVLDVPPFVLFWYALNESDVPQDQNAEFEALRPQIDAFIDAAYLQVKPRFERREYILNRIKEIERKAAATATTEGV